jgi:hypothetical protein
MGIAGIVVWFETKNNPTFTNMTARQFSNILNLILESGFHADQRPAGLQKRIISRTGREQNSPDQVASIASALTQELWTEV